MDTEKSKKPFDFERFNEEAMEGLYQGKRWGAPTVRIRPNVETPIGIDA